ncbi:DivIVA domain-containing protein [Streptomyces sp. JJ66]|uniref:DivIVA domain-containing protein n=1 Tax=Streptomyces sp. JJ66 TaxID=2803843 RepID=UPI001C56C36E|nr:DivIVA domain-containing protein [Streptomyces sp. JJ66]MBW1602944.1 DivIVA domain-containing protein [Streptomyces sp. JJ66]
MFWFMLLALLVVVGAVALAAVGSGDGRGGPARGGLTDPVPDGRPVPLPADRPLGRADVTGLRLPLAPRGYRMDEVDEVLARLGAELAERDARIAELEAELAGAQAAALGGSGLLDEDGRADQDRRESREDQDRRESWDGGHGVPGGGWAR